MPQSPPIALQLYTVRADAARDFQGTVRAVAEMGYDGVEFAGYAGLTSGEMRTLLEDNGLRVAGTHVGMDRLQRDFEGEIVYCHTIGCDCLVLPSLPDGLQAGHDVSAAVTLLNQLGRRCSEQGIAFAYHNHDLDFRLSQGRYFWQDLVERTDPNLVSFELDVYWAAYDGADPRWLLREHAERIPLVHLKDMGAERTQVDVGEGFLGLDALYLRLREIGVRWAVVEHDEPTSPVLECVRRSLHNLRATQGRSEA